MGIVEDKAPTYIDSAQVPHKKRSRTGTKPVVVPIRINTQFTYPVPWPSYGAYGQYEPSESYQRPVYGYGPGYGPGYGRRPAYRPSHSYDLEDAYNVPAHHDYSPLPGRGYAPGRGSQPSTPHDIDESKCFIIVAEKPKSIH